MADSPLSITSSSPLPAAGAAPLSIASSSPLPDAQTPSAASRFGSGVYATTIAPLVHLFTTNPIDTVTGMFKSVIGTSDIKAISDAAKSGDFGGAAALTAKYLSQGPAGRLMQPTSDSIARSVVTGDYAGAAGKVVGTAASLAAPEVLPAGLSALADTDVGAGSIAAVKAAGKAIVDPKTMLGAGGAAYVARAAGLPASAGAAAVIGPRLIAAGASAYKAALADRIAAAADSLAVPDMQARVAGAGNDAAPVTPAAVAPAAPPAAVGLTGQEMADVMARRAAAKASATQQVAAREAAPVAPAPAAPAGVSVAPGLGAPSVPGKSIAQTLQDEMAAQRAAAAPAAPVADPLLDGLAQGHLGDPNATFAQLAKKDPAAAAIVQSLADRMRAPAPEAATPAATSPARAPISTGPVYAGKTAAQMLQDEMAAQRAAAAPAAPAVETPALPNTEAPRSTYDANGDLKSPQLRAAEIKGANIDAKAQRIGDAMLGAGVSASDAGKIPMGRVSATQIAAGATPGWTDIVESLVNKGALTPGELPPSESIPRIILYMRQAEASAAAAK